MRQSDTLLVLLLVLLTVGGGLAARPKQSVPVSNRKGAKAAVNQATNAYRPDIVTAVQAAAKKDCGCGSCAAKGCEPCHGKNCYFCVAKALVAKDCGCSGCKASGCGSCGPGCDVCKFHLAPVAEATPGSPKPK